MRRVVPDTTVLVSAFLSERGASSELLRRARRGAFLLLTASEIIDETVRTLLGKESIRRRYPYPDEDVARFLRVITATATVVGDLPTVSGVVRDPNDDVIIACALKARADYLASLDKDLLVLGEHAGVRIVTPGQLLDLL